MATTPDMDLATHIGANVGALTLGTNVFAGKLMESSPKGSSGLYPDKAVACLADAGDPPEAYADGTSTELRPSEVTVLIRSDVRAVASSFADGQTLARAVRDAVHHASVSGYIDVAVLSAEPVYRGEDNAGRHQWSIQVRMLHEQ